MRLPAFYYIRVMLIDKLQINPNNPRHIKDDRFKNLVSSIKSFPDMMTARPLVVNEAGVILGGNMRFRALKALKYTEIPDEWVKVVKGWTKEQEAEFLIKDNANYGEWDYEQLANEWDDGALTDWGVVLPNVSETEKLSELEFEAIYYEPAEQPNITLLDCVNTDKYDAKIKALNDFDLTDAQKEMLKIFAYRFIRIDFESVANYYYFNASDEEKRAIERLRLVLCDGGVGGFIEDGIIKGHKIIEGWDSEA